ncbi:MAG: hypothetical protein ACREVO_08195 [Steroidobacteraceae bacterium]
MSEDGIDTIHPLGNSHLNWKVTQSVPAYGFRTLLSRRERQMRYGSSLPRA